MKKDKSVSTENAVELLQKIMLDPDSITNAEKRQLKKMINGDPSLMLEAATRMGETSSDLFSAPKRTDTRSDEEIVADNYIELAKFVIEQMKLKNVSGLQAKAENGFQVFALTPAPIELDFAKYVTSRYPLYKEKLLEAEALQADLFLEDGTENFKLAIIQRIKNATL